MTIKASSYPTSRPTLDLNFARTKRLDPRVTFTRSSTGTYVDANGVLQSAATNTARFDHNPVTGESLGLLVEEARTNSLLYSADFGNAVWNKSYGTLTPNSLLAPDGTLTAALFQANGASTGFLASGLYQTFSSIASGTALCLSFYVKNNNASTVSIAFGSLSNAFHQTTYTFATGAFSNNTGSTGTSQDIGNGWTRLTLSVSSSLYSTTRALIRPDSTNSVYIWGAQLEAGTFPTSYIPTPATFTSRASSATYYDANGIVQTAGTNVARSAAFFPDSNGVMRPAGLLLEAAGTNLIVSSQVFNSGGWNLDGASLTANATTAPDGTVTATSIVQGTGDNRTYHFDNNGAGNKTFSIFAKSNAGSSIQIYGAATFGTNSNATATLNTANGTVSGATGCTSQALANGWYRFSIPVFIGTGFGNTNWLAFTGPASSVYIWGAQLEASPYPTSYIATTTATVTRSADVSSSATVTRSADVASMTGTNFSSWYNQSQGTIFSLTRNVPFGGGLWYFGPGGSPRWWARYETTGIRSESFDGIGGGAGINLGISGAGTGVTLSSIRHALAINNVLQQQAGSANGGTTVNGSWDSNVGVSALALGVRSDNPGYLNGTISRLTYWPVRLSDATLQAITQ